MLSATDLATARATVTASMTDTAQVLRATSVPDGEGGQTETWTVVATVPCRVAAADITPMERDLATQVLPRTLWRISLPAQTQVTSQDRLAIGTWVYDILGVLAPRSYELSTQVVAVAR